MTLLADLTACVGEAHVLTDDAFGSYQEDPRGRFKGKAMAVVQPRTTQEVSAVVKLCAKHQVCIIPYAGGTGLVGGQTYLGNRSAILLSIERMTRIRAHDTQSMTIEAGCTLSEIHQAAEIQAQQFPLWMASQGSARIGGVLATNAGGLHVIRYGMARDLCLGVEAVMADGNILSTLKRVLKSNTGYDLKNLLIGSEGTLGILTAATLKLITKPDIVETAFCPVASPAAAIDLFQRCQATGLLSACELVSAQGFSFFQETGIDLSPPCTPADWYVLVEFSGSRHLPIREALESTLTEANTNAVIAQTQAQRQKLWAIREHLPEANRRIGSVCSHDISVPLEAIPTFIQRMQNAVSKQGETLRTHIFGHIGDGNLHANVFPAAGKSRADYAQIRTNITHTVHDLVHALEGSISAEHGIGRIKVDDLERYGDSVSLEYMRRIKQAFDPHNIFNPDAVFKL